MVRSHLTPVKPFFTMAYKDDLKNGRWQKVRLQVMERDSFCCRACGSKSILHVHHLFYRYGLKPWEYPMDSLVTLCVNCHNKLHNELSEKAGIIAFNLLTNKPIIDDKKLYSGFELNNLVEHNKKLTISSLTQEWNLLINKINPNLYRNILNCDKLELINESEIIIYYCNNLQKISIEKYLLEIITHFRLVFSNHNISITLKPTTLL